MSDRIARHMLRFTRSEDGAISVWSLFLFVTVLIVGSAAVDVTYLLSLRTQMQIAADAGAHAAIFRRNQAGVEADDARADAMAVMEYTVPEAFYGDVITEDDVLFGSYDAATDTFTTDPESTEAVLVRADLDGANAARTLLLRLVGVDTMEVGASALGVAMADLCAHMQGMFANGPVTPNSNNTFTNVCVHSQTSASVQNNPTFNPGSYISAPNLQNVTCQNNCTGFEEARRSARYNLSPYYDPLQGATTGPALLSQVDQVMALMPDLELGGISRTINNIPVSSTHVTPSPALMNRVHYFNCNGGNLTLSGTWTRAVLLLNDCKVRADNNLILSDTILYNTRTDDRTSFNFGSGRNAANLVVGSDTDCNGTGAGYILTRGGFDAPAKMTFNNGTIIARGNVKFAAQFGGADGYARGMSVIAKGSIDTTSNSTFTGCEPPAGTPPRLVTYALAR